MACCGSVTVGRQAAVRGAGHPAGTQTPLIGALAGAHPGTTVRVAGVHRSRRMNPAHGVARVARRDGGDGAGGGARTALNACTEVSDMHAR